MFSTIGLEIVMIAVLVLLNGVLATAEIALVSARKPRLEQRARGGSAGARAALDLAASPSRFLSTVQIGITLVGILAGAFGGATLAEELGALLSRMPALAPWADAIGLAIVVLGITYLSLVFGELVPKQLALHRPEAIAGTLARPLALLSRVTSPAVRLLELSTRLVVRLLGSKPSDEPPITDEEIRHLLKEGTRAGVFAPGEKEIVERVLRVGDRRVGELVTPRSQIAAIDADDPLEQSLARIAESGHSYLPLYRGTLDRVVGLVSSRSVLEQVLKGQRPSIADAVVDPLFLPETLPALKALERFRSTGRHVALVLDEYGGVEGLVTIGDVVEAIVGELPAFAEEEPMVVRREDGSLLVDGMLPIAELVPLLELAASAAAELDDYQTLGGFVMGRAGRVPSPGDHLDWQGWRFEVVDMDGRRVDRVLVTQAPAAGPPAGS